MSKQDYHGFDLTEPLIKIIDEWLEWKGYESIEDYGDKEVVPYEDAETRIGHMEGRIGYEPLYLYEHLYYNYLREFRITKANFLDFYFNTGADQDQMRMREYLGYEMVEGILDGKYTYTFDVQRAWEGCGYIRMSYCEGIEDGHPLEDYEDIDLDFINEIHLI